MVRYCADCIHYAERQRGEVGSRYDGIGECGWRSVSQALPRYVYGGRTACRSFKPRGAAAAVDGGARR